MGRPRRPPETGGYHPFSHRRRRPRQHAKQIVGFQHDGVRAQSFPICQGLPTGDPRKPQKGKADTAHRKAWCLFNGWGSPSARSVRMERDPKPETNWGSLRSTWAGCLAQLYPVSGDGTVRFEFTTTSTAESLRPGHPGCTALPARPSGRRNAGACFR